jgi:hypothetical protein
MTPGRRKQVFRGVFIGGYLGLVFTLLFLLHGAVGRSKPHEAPLSLDLCRDELRDTEALCRELSAKHEAERAELRDRIFKLSDQLYRADERAMDAAKELKCGKELLFEQWRADGCEKRLKGRIMRCPCVDLEDAGDPDDHGTAEGF